MGGLGGDGVVRGVMIGNGFRTKRNEGWQKLIVFGVKYVCC